MRTLSLAAGALIGILCGNWLATPVAAQPFSAQIQRALQILGITPGPSGGSIIQFTDGAVTAPSITFVSQPDFGWFRTGAFRTSLASNGVSVVGYYGPTVNWSLGSNVSLGWAAIVNADSAPDVILLRDAANTLAQRNGTNAQTFRLYGTTTGPKYLSLSHDGTNGVIDTAASSGLLSLAPTNATGLLIGKPISLSSAAIAVANVGANSCGTTAATIAGSNNAFVITVGATSGTQCRVAFTVAATTEWNCTVTDSTTTIATRATPVDTTHTDFLGAFVAADKVTGICFAR